MCIVVVPNFAGKDLRLVSTLVQQILPTVRHLCDISMTVVMLPGRNVNTRFLETLFSTKLIL